METAGGPGGGGERQVPGQQPGEIFISHPTNPLLGNSIGSLSSLSYIID